MPELINAWTEARRLRDSWIKHYGSRSAEAVKALVDLGPNPFPDAVDVTMKAFAATKANRVSRSFSCDECGANLETVVRLGKISNYGAHTADVCGKCLLEALELLEES